MKERVKETGGREMWLTKKKKEKVSVNKKENLKNATLCKTAAVTPPWPAVVSQN